MIRDAGGSVLKSAPVPMTSANYSQSSDPEFEAFLEKIYIPAERQRDFYLFIAVFTDWLDRHGIAYFMHSGTALGAVRHGGFIPWDDDFDIMIEEGSEKKLVEGFPELATYGVMLSEKHRDNGHYQFFFKNPKVPSSKDRYYCFDIFVGRHELVNQRAVLHYKHPDFHKWFLDRYCPVDDVFPLKRIAFGPLQLWAMNDHTDYFRRSNFRTDEATIRIHLMDQKWVEEQIAYFRKRNLYPIRDRSVLQYKPQIDWAYEGLDAYRIPARQ